MVLARSHRVVRPLVRIRRQGTFNDWTTSVDDLLVLQVLLPGAPHRTRPVRTCPPSKAGLRILHPRAGSQGTRCVPRPAGLCGGRDHAFACLLALNGLRISEALGAEIDNLDVNRGHRTLFIHRKGSKTVTIPLSPRPARALDLYIGERESGPIFLNHGGTGRFVNHDKRPVPGCVVRSSAGVDVRARSGAMRSAPHTCDVSRVG